MEILLALILFMIASIVLGKFSWKLKTSKFVVAAIVALIQVAFVVYSMLNMKLPW